MEDFLFLLVYTLPLIFLIIGIYNLYKYFSGKSKRKHFETEYRNHSDKEFLTEKYLRANSINLNASSLSLDQKFTLLEQVFARRINRHLIFSISSIFLFLLLTAFEFTTLTFRNAVEHDPKYEVEELVKGKIAYDIPDTMKLGEDYRGIVSITKSQDDSFLLKGLDRSDFEIEQITISSRVKASLVDPTNINFDINPLSTEEQLVDDSSNTTWRWNIKPKKSGKNILMLKVSVKIKNRLGETLKDILVFDKPFFVESSATTEAKNFFSEYWQWLSTVLIIPIFLWLRSLYLTRRKNNKNKREPIGFKKSGT